MYIFRYDLVTNCCVTFVIVFHVWLHSFVHFQKRIGLNERVMTICNDT